MEKVLMNSVQIRDYMEHFAIPVATELISSKNQGMTGSDTNHIDNCTANEIVGRAMSRSWRNHDTWKLLVDAGMHCPRGFYYTDR